MTKSQALNAVFEAGYYIRKAYNEIHQVAYDRKGGLSEEELRDIRDELRSSVSDELATLNHAITSIYTLDPWKEN